MKRSNYSDDEDDDPSVPPADGTSPIDLLPPDMFYQIVMAPGQSIRDIARLCRVDRRFRAACTREYVWRKLYFLKVVKSPGLAAMKEPEAARHINSELMYTPEGVQWTAQLRFAQTPYILLMAFAYRTSLYKHPPTITFGLLSPDGTLNFLAIIHPADLFAEANSEEILNDFQIPKDQSYARTLATRFTHRGYVSHDRLMFLLCSLLNRGWVPTFDAKKPLVLTQSCLSCGSPTAPFQCGAECGQARYCDQECANTHWEEHRKECSSSKH
jgi:hypothetical protein